MAPFPFLDSKFNLASNKFSLERTLCRPIDLAATFDSISNPIPSSG